MSKPLPIGKARFIASTGADDIVVVSDNGDIACISGESLERQWTASIKPLVQDVVATSIRTFEVEYVTTASIAELREGIFKHRPETFSALPRGSNNDEDMLLVISKSSSPEQETRHLSVLAASPSTSSSDLQRLTPLDVTPLAFLEDGEVEESTYQLDPQGGSLLNLQGGRLAVYDLTGSVPKLKSIIQTGNAKSCIRLSRPFALSCSLDTIQLYNYQYRSVHAKAVMDLSDLPSECQQPQHCQLITYLRSQELVLALVDNVLVSIQVESPKNLGKRKKEGLLIDAIRRGTTIEIPAKRARQEKQSLEFSRHVPGSMTEDYLIKYQADIEKADRLLSRGDLVRWEEFLKKKFSMHKKEKKALTNGNHVNGDSAVSEIPEWEWEVDHREYSPVDRRWVLYAISQLFSLESSDTDDSAPTTMRLLLPDSNVFTYLVLSGKLSLANIKSAFRDDLEGQATSDKAMANDLIKCLVDADPSMNLLLNYIEATKLGEVELLLAIKSLMLSMGLISDDKVSQMKLLRNAPKEPENEDMDLDDLEREIALTEHYLGDESSSRSRGLTLAFSKLWRFPSRTTVQALRNTLKTTEVLSIVYVLRVELVRGAWTSLYVDPTSFDSEGNEPPPDGVISLIADLLGRCIDAIGSGGWLFNDAVAFSDATEATDFLTGLKLEVSAALEGLEAAVFLNGIVSEVTRYNMAYRKSVTGYDLADARQARGFDKPMTLSADGRESRLLPLGLKTKSLISKERVVGGGEVMARSARETGHLISQKVEAYSLEKVSI